MRASLVGTTVLAAVAAAVVLPAGAVSASTDSTAPKITSVSAPAIVGKTSKGAVFEVTVKATDNIEITRVAIGLLDGNGQLKTPFRGGESTVPVKGYTDDGTWKVQVQMPANFPLGNWNVTAYAMDSSGNISSAPAQVRDSFVLKLATKIAKLNANPEPVKKGQAMTVTGTLRYAVVSGWAGYANKVVKVQFLKAGTTAWKNVGTAVSGSNGTFSFATTAPGAGQWRAVYKGDATTAKATSGIDTVALAH